MKMALKVAKAELRNLFYSPIAWFLMIVFLIQCGITYMGMLENFARQQEMGGQSLEWMKDLTSIIFTSRGGLFSTVMQNLYLYIPLLTMGLISREINGGTIKLLYSSPIKVNEIVFGKFLAMMAYSLILVAIVGVFVAAGLFNIRSVDSGMLFTALLGFYLLLCTYSAIGLFMSCLTTYQVVAAVSTFVMIGILSYIGSLWQQYDFVRDLTYFLSLQGRTEHMLRGLLTTKDVFYFLIIIYIFLGLSILKLKAGRESLSSLAKAGKYAVIVVSALIVGYVTSRPKMVGYYDATANKSRTLTPKVQDIIHQLGDDPLEITVYNNLLGNYSYYGMPSARNMFMEVWEPYIRFKPDIKFNFVNYYDSSYDSNMEYLYKQYPGKNLKEIGDMYAKNNEMKLSAFLPPSEIHKLIDLKPELNRLVMHVKYKDRSTFLRVYDDNAVFPGETEVSAALKRLMLARLPKIAFLSGDLERNINKLGDKDYRVLTSLSTFRNSLVNQGFNVDTVSLETQEIPANISTLVVSDPKVELSAVTMDKLQKYIDNGGNLLIAGEPNKQAILNPLLQQLGVQLTEGTIIQESKDFSPDLVTPYLTDMAGSFSKRLAKSVADSAKVSMPRTVGLSYTTGGAYTIKPLLMTDAKLTWNRKQKLDLETMTSANASGGEVAATGGLVMTAVAIGGSDMDSQQKKSAAAGTVTFSAADGDQRGPIPITLSLTRQVNGKEQRIIVSGDADFMSNSELKRGNNANFIFSTALFSWLSYGEFPIDASRPDSKDTRVNITSDGVDLLKIAFIWVLPGLLLLAGAVLLIRRKRK